MKFRNIPENFTDLLALSKVADCLSWHRDARKLSLIIDDLERDRRTCIDFYVEHLRAEIRTLCNYDPVKKRWSDYCQPQMRLTFDDKRGSNAFFVWIRERAQEQTGWPNPESLYLYKFPTTPVSP